MKFYQWRTLTGESLTSTMPTLKVNVREGVVHKAVGGLGIYSREELILEFRYEVRARTWMSRKT